MGIDYISAFNSGELSEYIDSRVDIEPYRSGCAVLENMYVIPQGGVERRSGTQYMGEAMDSNARLIPFNFSADIAFVVEFGDTHLRVYDGDGYTGVEIEHPYSEEEISALKYKRIFDRMYLTCPTKPVYTLNRIAIDPLEFELVALEFTYPPFLEENSDIYSMIGVSPLGYDEAVEYGIDDEILMGAPAELSGQHYICTTETTGVFDVADWKKMYKNFVTTTADREVYVTANSEPFTESQTGSILKLRHKRSETQSGDKGSWAALVDGVQYSETVDVSNVTYWVDAYTKDKSYHQSTEFNMYLESDTGAGFTTKVAWTSGTSAISYKGSGAIHELVRLKMVGFIDSHFKQRVYEISANSNRRVSGNTTNSNTSDPLDVSFSNWSITTGGEWKGVVELEKSYDGGASWDKETTIGDTYNVDQRNFIVNSPAKEQANTLIRIKYIKDPSQAGVMKFSIVNGSLYSEGLIRLDEYIDANTFKGTITNTLGSSAPTPKWAEGAFSDRRGYPNAIELYENRIVYSGTFNDPSTIWMSIVGDYDNFQLGVNDDEALKFSPGSSETTQWLLTKESLHQGTVGGIINNFSVNDKTTITPSTIKTSSESSYGCADIQAIFANDVSVYVQRLGKKLRELVFNWETNKFDSNDLTIMSNHVTANGISEVALQKVPDQIVWILNRDGTIAGLTYERNEAVAGWHRQDFGGKVLSICVRSASGDDELWIAVERAGKVYIEKTEPRFFETLLDTWYVDSGVKEVLSPTTAFDSLSADGSDHFITTSISHGLSSDDIIRFGNNVNSEEFVDKIGILADATIDTFALKDTFGNYLKPSQFDEPVGGWEVLSGDYTPVSNVWSGLDHLEGQTVQIQGDGGYAGHGTVVGGAIETDDYYNQTVIGLQFVSTLQPMFIEPSLATGTTLGSNKNISKVVVKFLKTIGGLVGIKDSDDDKSPRVEPEVFRLGSEDLKTEYSTENVIFRTTSDSLGLPIEPFTGDKLVYTNDGWNRLKGLYVVQNIPMPMTVLSMTIFIDKGSNV